MFRFAILMVLLGCTAFNSGCSVAYGVYDDQRLTGTIAEDKALASSVKTSLLGHDFGTGWNVAVYSYYGHLFIIGDLPPNNRQDAVTIARRDPRVRSVTCHWFKAANTDSSDFLLATKLRKELISTSNLSSTRIDTEVMHGQIVLLGVVADDRERNLAISVAERLVGSQRVTSYLLLPEQAQNPPQQN